ncbi:hypothetical protein [uncultured Erythrobacter sp.]|uniref:hypothetical protein n=1 Tax=uncultured Erythrobacter sp. TaxID=263913 RepID=UPI00260BDC79|nr:hypothetical protein [uncultured Erythrobacter sp.]
MPSIDGGYYFLTVLVPVRRAWNAGEEDGRAAPIIELRKTLAQLPTAMQTPGAHESGEISAFSRSTRTHFARFSVIDRLGYNGYEAADPVLDTLGLATPSVARTELESPYLLFAAEFDAPSGSRNYDLAVYLRELWEVMEDDLVKVFSNCVAFDKGSVTTAAEFIEYIKRCELETTMPFNFYWAEPPTSLPTLTLKGLAIGAGLTGLAMGALFWWLFSPYNPIGPLGYWWALIPGAIAAIGGAIGFVAMRFKKYGDRAFPTPPDGDLISVLKGLHLQNTFGQFVIDNQGAGEADLHKAFGEYLDKNEPQKPEPRHPAGEVFG